MGLKPKIHLVVVDLDNTLYDWMTFFAGAFDAMLEVASSILNVSVEQLVAEMKVVHQKHQNSEPSTGLLESLAVQSQFGHLSRVDQHKRMMPAFDVFERKRSELLVCYPSVWDTLQQWEREGVALVGYTDAPGPAVVSRLGDLHLLNTFAHIYAATPTGPHPHSYPPSPPVSHLSPQELKPNPQVLQSICTQWGVTVSETLFIGDSLSRDVAMARDAGVRSAWAKYGTMVSSQTIASIERVTHWTDEKVARERGKSTLGIRPSVVLEQFSDVLRHFDFQGLNKRSWPHNIPQGVDAVLKRPAMYSADQALEVLLKEPGQVKSSDKLEKLLRDYEVRGGTGNWWEN